MDKQQHKLEVLNLRHDTLKHLTTLSGAGVAALLAIYQRELLDISIVTGTLILFGISAISGLLGMDSAMADLESPTAEVTRTTKWAYTATQYTLLFAIWGVISEAIQIALPWYVTLSIAARY